MKKLIDERMEATKRDKTLNKQVSIDRNMVIVNIPTQFTVGTSFSRHPSYPKLGHRVIYISTQSKIFWADPSIPFGKVGTVTGVYKNKIEIMFDQPFIGATSLYGRCHFFRGAKVNLLEIFNLSEWKPFVNLKKTALEALSQGTPLPEWDGRLDQYQLIDEILTIRQQCTGDDFGDYRAEHGGAKTKYYRDKKDDKNKKFKKGGFRRGNGNGKKKEDKLDKPEKEDDNDGFFAEEGEADGNKKEEMMSENK